MDIVNNAPVDIKKKDIAAEVGVPPSTLSTILKNQDSLRASYGVGSKKRKRNREPSRINVDEGLFQWFSAARAQAVPISGSILKNKAEEICRAFDPTDSWTCSNGWISRWKERHNIAYRAISGESAFVDRGACDEWKQQTLIPILQQYKAEDVFNADETGLYWRLLPDKTHAVAGETCSGGKNSKERVTVLVCTNMTGSEKRPLLTIGKFKHPRCFNGVRHLPTEYEANKSAWMTSVIFEAWLRSWDIELTRKARKVILFVDNCTAHPHIKDLDSIELVFLPPNTTSVIQPCDQGIIYNMKTHYRKLMVKRLIQAIDSGCSMAAFKITLLEAMQMLRVAWDSVKMTTIVNCFKKGGFITHQVDLEESDDEEVNLDDLHLDEAITFNEYVNSDKDLQCAPMLTSEEIVHSLRASPDIDSDTVDDCGESLSMITSQAACMAFHGRHPVIFITKYY